MRDLSALVISGFPGIGKSYFQKITKSKVLDSDSSKFSWLEPGIRNPNFPRNYIEHIKENLYKVDIILVSSHKIVRDALIEARIHFSLIMPDFDAKQEYLDRYAKRGNDPKFINFMSVNWNSFIQECFDQPGCEKYILEPNEYLSDVFKHRVKLLYKIKKFFSGILNEFIFKTKNIL